MYALTKNNIHKSIFNMNGPQALTLDEFVATGNQVTGNNVVVKNINEEGYAGFDAIGVPRTTDGVFKGGLPAPYSSEGMVTFARAIRLIKMNVFTNDFEELTGTTRTVAHMFANKEKYSVGNRNARFIILIK